jgi:ABC-type polysaccharide/polyol phosphate export permease
MKLSLQQGHKEVMANSLLNNKNLGVFWLILGPAVLAGLFYFVNKKGAKRNFCFL